MYSYLRLHHALGFLLLSLIAGACGGDLDRTEGGEEAKRIRTVVGPETAGSVEVDVDQDGEGQRRIDITVTGAPTDSVGIGSLVASDGTRNGLERPAEAMARALSASYEHADRVGQVEISFMKKAELGPIEVNFGHTFDFDGAELEKL